MHSCFLILSFSVIQLYLQSTIVALIILLFSSSSYPKNMPRNAGFHVLKLKNFRESMTDPIMAHTLSREGQEGARKLTLSPGAENPSYASVSTTGLPSWTPADAARRL